LILPSSSEAIALDNHSGPPLQLHVDVGNGATYIVPSLKGTILVEGVRRLDYSGKLLTKLLIQSVSMRQVKLTDHYLTAEHVKEQMCYVAKDYKNELNSDKHAVEYYALPDVDIKKAGYKALSRDETNFQQYVQMAHERFSIPEHIFSPAL
jgi:actin-related protein